MRIVPARSRSSDVTYKELCEFSLGKFFHTSAKDVLFAPWILFSNFLDGFAVLMYSSNGR